MLKIIDDIDYEKLNELKFRPKYNEDTGKIEYYYREYCKWRDLKHKPEWVSRVEIDVKTKRIETWKQHRTFKNKREFRAIIGKLSDEFDLVEILYDLIKAGLVKKVGE